MYLAVSVRVPLLPSKQHNGCHEVVTLICTSRSRDIDMYVIIYSMSRNVQYVYTVNDTVQLVRGNSDLHSCHCDCSLSDRPV